MKQNTIGILGLGDLGKRLAVQAAKAGLLVIAYDLHPTVDSTFRNAVDPALSTDPAVFDNIRIVASQHEVLSSCRIVHWAIPSASLGSLPDLSQCTTTVVLHDSVMSNSEQALASRSDRDKFAIVHCLINDSRRVIVTTEHDEVIAHFRHMGLEPKVMSTREHDSLLAHSQGIAATLIHLGIKDELDKAYRDGNLTPSGEELLGLLQNRQLNWTDSTMRSILGNPELRALRGRIGRES